MAHKPQKKFLLHVVVSALLCTALYRRFLSPSATTAVSFPTAAKSSSFFSVVNFVIRENLTNDLPIPPPEPPPLLSTTAVLLPEWEVLLIVYPETPPSTLDGYFCRFETGETTTARFSGVLPFPDRATFSCPMPGKYRQNRRLLKQPILLKSTERVSPATPMPPILRWSYLVYDSLTTDDDVVLFAKGVNNRHGINRPPTDLRCIFSVTAGSSIRTVVTSSAQEVFRCKLPEPSPLAADGVTISLEIVAEGQDQVVPSVAYYTRQRRLVSYTEKSLLCATTVVYNVTKFLNEWILYHSKIGVEKFLLYDNGSEDDLHRSVNDLVAQGYDVNIYSWRWPKTQESGFSHSAVYARDACSWMMYLDVDEFIFSPSWQNLSRPSKSLLQSQLPSKSGQIIIGCHEFGPSYQTVHPPDGVTQGYSCRRRNENRHKSIVLLSAVDDSLVNVIHHFQLKAGQTTRRIGTGSIVVNHYKYQAWPEFKAKFRRRVSAYVLDWTQKLNPNSKDRTPGLGFEPVEPEGWARKFCEVWDYSLKALVRRWFEPDPNSNRIGSDPNSGRVKLT